MATVFFTGYFLLVELYELLSQCSNYEWSKERERKMVSFCYTRAPWSHVIPCEIEFASPVLSLTRFLRAHGTQESYGTNKLVESFVLQFWIMRGGLHVWFNECTQSAKFKVGALSPLPCSRKFANPREPHMERSDNLLPHCVQIGGI